MTPPSYAWLDSVGPLPRLVAEGLKLVGVHESAGPADSPVIMGWAKEVGLASAYSGDEVPWCGLFMAVVAKRAGKAVPADPLWALNWLKFGEPSPVPGLGDVLAFQRKLPGGGVAGHVGIYIGEDATAFHVLGGNQSDAVTITRVERSRLRGARRLYAVAAPASARPYQLAGGGALSTNEA